MVFYFSNEYTKLVVAPESVKRHETPHDQYFIQQKEVYRTKPVCPSPEKPTFKPNLRYK